MFSAIFLITAGLLGADITSAAAHDTAELQAYLAEAAENHPGLKQRHAEWLAALERVPQATALEDPMFAYTQFLQSDNARAKLEISQMFPWFGTLRLRGEQAALEADAVLSRFFAERDGLFFGIRQAYHEYALLGKQTGIVEAQVELLNLVEEIVITKLSLGMATDDELYRVGIAKSEMVDRLAALQQMRPALSVQLATALGRQGADTLGWPEESEPPGETPDFGAALTAALAHNPALDGLERRMAALQAQEALARKAGHPTIGLGFEWTDMKRMKMTQDNMTGTTGMGTAGMAGGAGDFFQSPSGSSYIGGKDEYMLKLSLTLPVWRKKVKAGVEEARLMQNAVGHERHALALELESAVRMAHYRAQDAARRHALMRDSLIPQARMTYESLLDKYAADAGGKTFLDILDSVQMLLDFQLEWARAHTEWHKALAETALLTGTA